MTNLVKQLDKFSSSQVINASEKFKEFFSEFLRYIESNLKTAPEKIDVDALDEEFIDNFKRTYISNIPDTNALKSLNITEIKRILKEITNVNKNKGVIESIEYVFRVLYGYDVTVESGINADSVEYKPEDYTFETVDEFGNPVQYDPNILSNECFTFLDSPTIKGFVVTVFLENGTSGTPHLWVEKLYGKVNDGDLIYFPNINRYVRILSTNKLELDGWAGKEKRFRTGYFYSSTKFNEKLFSIYKSELYGYDYLNGATYTDYSFGDVTNGLGQIVDLELSFSTGSANTTHSFTYSIVLPDGVQANCDVSITVQNRQVINFTINNQEVNAPISDKIIYRLSAYEFIRQDNGLPIVSKDIIDERITRIAMFTFILRTELKYDVFMRTMRNIVLPAGYNFIVFFTIIGNFVSTRENTKILEYSTSTPAYFIEYTGLKQKYLGAYTIELPWFIKRFFYSQDFGGLTFEKYDKYYKFGLWADKFYNRVDVFDYIGIDYLSSQEYKTDSVYEKAVGTIPVNKGISTNIKYNINLINITYNLKLKRGEINYPRNEYYEYIKVSSFIDRQTNISISFEQFDKYYKFSLWADKFFNVGNFDDLPVNIEQTPEYTESLLYNIRTTSSTVIVS